MRLSALSFRIHRWLGWLVGLQVLLWMLGGMVLAVLALRRRWRGAHKPAHR